MQSISNIHAFLIFTVNIFALKPLYLLKLDFKQIYFTAQYDNNNNKNKTKFSLM